VRIHIASGNVTETQDVDFCPNISADFDVLFSKLRKLMKSMRSNGVVSTLQMMLTR
jgi:hypothetical protein